MPTHASIHPPADLEELRAAISDIGAELRERYGISRLAIFGSWVRGEQRADSDVDLLVEFDRTPSLLTFVRLQNELGDRLGLPVDLVLARKLHPRLAPLVLQEAVDCAA